MEEIEEFLLSRGFYPFVDKDPGYVRKVLYQRRIEGVAPLCACNDHLNLNVRLRSFEAQGTLKQSAEVGIHAQRVDGSWLTLNISVTAVEDIPAKLAQFEHQLVAAWEASSALVESKHPA